MDKGSEIARRYDATVSAENRRGGRDRAIRKKGQSGGVVYSTEPPVDTTSRVQGSFGEVFSEVLRQKIKRSKSKDTKGGVNSK